MVEAALTATATAPAPAPAPAPKPKVAAPAATTAAAASTKASSTVLSGLPFKIQSKVVREQNQYLKVLIYATFGVGKTFLAGTAADVPSMNDVLMLSAESGTLTLDSSDHPSFANIDSIPVQDYKSTSEVYKYLQLHCKYRDLKTPEAELKLKQLQSAATGMPVDQIVKVKRYNTVIVDSLTEIEAYCMNQLLNINADIGLADDVQTAEWSEYKKQHSMVGRFVRAFRDLPMHVIMICSSTYTQDEQKRMIYSPSLTGKLTSQVQGFMDVVGYYVAGNPDEKGNIPRRLYVQPVGKFAAKCRFANFKGSYFDNPTMGSILKQVGLLQA